MSRCCLLLEHCKTTKKLLPAAANSEEMTGGDRKDTPHYSPPGLGTDKSGDRCYKRDLMKNQSAAIRCIFSEIKMFENLRKRFNKPAIREAKKKTCSGKPQQKKNSAGYYRGENAQELPPALCALLHRLHKRQR